MMWKWLGCTLRDYGSSLNPRIDTLPSIFKRFGEMEKGKRNEKRRSPTFVGSISTISGSVALFEMFETKAAVAKTGVFGGVAGGAELVLHARVRQQGKTGACQNR